VLPNDVERERLLARAHRSGLPAEEGSGGPVVRDPSGNALVLAVG